ncbi:putative nucleotidyltransferase-like protein [Anaerobacterium chartisolvens]|uniref:Putative nucleotidyltransferase-like protein n=1 Tax=Anaerobacterium chartisolvens TaxID=1297424 RepID=A0A369ATZ7_9FIRM|nr:nucleotidyltransferase family protein [Anaerobacterium chartisolvens]RCX12555.1 putative nucleotidyltransferase-like protein [Anaerobacterium chartisolvens]
MPLTVKELSKERQLVLLCSRGVLNEQHISEIKEIMEGRLDWKEILYQGITHRTLNIMYYHLSKLGLAGKVEEEVLKAMKTQSKVYAIRNKSYFAEIAEIFKKLHEAGIRVAILKGNFLASKVYPSVETRTFNDLDFLIDVRDGDKIVKILEDLGYIQGEVDEKGDIIPSTRKQKMLQQLASNELQECLKKSDNPFTPMFQVDLNFDVLWKGNCPCKIDTPELLERAVEVDIDGARTYILDYEDFLVQLACHLYKEAALLHWINDLRDLKIYKFADILMFVEKYSSEINWDKLVSFCKRVGCEKIVYYAFYYVNLMYGEVIPQNVMAQLEPENKDYLDEYGIENQKPAKWEFDFFTRMFETCRVLEISEDMMSGTDRFWSTKKNS